MSLPRVLIRVAYLPLMPSVLCLLFLPCHRTVSDVDALPRTDCAYHRQKQRQPLSHTQARNELALIRPHQGTLFSAADDATRNKRSHLVPPSSTSTAQVPESTPLPTSFKSLQSPSL